MKKVVSLILSASMALTAVAAVAEEAPAMGAIQQLMTQSETSASATIIDFADGNAAFAGVEMAKGNADASELSVVDYAGGKALRVDVKAKVPYVALNLEGLLGENLTKVRKITFDVGVELGSDGNFYAASGKVTTVTTADKAETAHDWSVYMARKNPKKAVIALNEGEAFVGGGLGEYLYITKEADAFIDSDKFPGEEPRDFYISNIQFLDAEGNALPLDLTAEYVAPATEEDRTNLSDLTNVVEFPGFACEGGAWSQNGLSMTEEFRAALVPGSVIEISFESESGDMWIVLPDSGAGWMRVAQGTAAINNSKTTAQITYEQIAAVCGEDVSTWGDRLQCESAGAWKVYSVKVGTKAPRKAFVPTYEFPGFSCEAGAWTQAGFDMTQEFLDAIVPGTVVEINFESASGDMWLVLPDSGAGWMRVAQGAATIIGNKAYITYDQLVAAVGEDKTTWGARLQCEASDAWSVYSVKVGKLVELQGSYQNVEFPGFAFEGGAWSQNGLEMTPEIIAALVPGSVVNISYESETGNIWIVMPDSAAGWMRVEQGTANCDGHTCQITYEQIAAVCGEDASTWGARMQCESDGAWSVYAVSVGMAQ